MSKFEIFIKNYFREINIYIHYFNDYPFIFMNGESLIFATSLKRLFRSYLSYIKKNT